jgi:hypothetical protein
MVTLGSLPVKVQVGGGANYMKIGYFCARAELNPAFDIFQPNRDEVYIR